VPASFPTNQIFVNTDGSQWMYSASQGTWINVGTPYNPNAPSASSPVSAAPGTVAVPVISTAPNVAGTPVPANYPTNQIYVNSDGSQWVYSAATNSWVNMALTTSTSSPTTSTGAPISVSVATPTSASPYDSLINFATEQSLLPGVPNWLIAIGAVIAVKMAGQMGGRR